MLLPVVFLLISSSARAETFELTINVSICDTTWQDSLYVTFNGQGYSIEPGNPLILQVTQGYYTISATCPGNGSSVLENIYITEDTEVYILLPCIHYPVRNVYVDPLTSEAVWSVPRIDKLSEDFEPAQFPPPAWQAESEGEGWYRTDDGSGGGWTVQPRGGHYACVNDLLAGAGNDGSMDYLVTPVLELDYTGNYVLEFDSYYDSLNGQQAMVEYSLDGGGTWDVFYTPSPSTDWDFISLDLSSFSGQGSDPVMFAFHADDQGLDASGWAIDDVEVFSPDRPPMLIDYYVYVDDSLVGTTDTTRFFIEGLTYGQDYNVCVAARYPSGLSETACDSVSSVFLIPPSCFYQADTGDMPLIVCPPLDSTGMVPDNLIGYNLYFDYGFYKQLPPETTYFYPFDNNPGPNAPGIYSFFISSVYDLEPYGFPGEEGESFQLLSDYVFVFGFELEFIEDWSSELGFDNHYWEVPGFGLNWSINNEYGNPLPCAHFSGDPSGSFLFLSDYSIPLTSHFMNAYSLHCGRIFLDFDIELESESSSGLEEMVIEIWNWSYQEWQSVFSYSNSDSNFNWTHKSLEITDRTLNQVFRVRFAAEGQNSSDITGWYIDNINVYRVCNPPVNLGSFWNEECMMLSWDPPEGSTGPGSGDSLTGYHIYRSPGDDNYEFLALVDSSQTSYCDTVSRNEYCYKIKASYTKDGDTCLSEFSNTDCSTVGMDEMQASEGLTVFPNPVINILNIKCSDRMDRIEVYNYLGQLVEVISPGSFSAKLDLSGYPKGILLLKATTPNVTHTRKIIVSK